MHRIVLVGLVCGVVLASADRPAAQSVRQQFVGTWRLVLYEQIDGKGQVTYPRGRQPRGLIIYDATGHMAAQLMNDERPKDASANASPDEVRAALRTYTAYFGTYTIDERDKSVTHHREGDVNPQGVGVDAKRFYEFKGDRLILTPPPTEVNGEKRTTRITWERIR